MNLIPLLVAGLAALPVIGMAAWVWLAMASATEDMCTLVGFEGMHFED